jgi:hypothetical protein
MSYLRVRSASNAVPLIWRVRVERLPRYPLPLISVRLNGWLNLQMVLSSGESTTSIAPPVAEQLQSGAPLRRGRRVIASDAGPTIARLARVDRLEIRTIDGHWPDCTPRVVAIAFRPQALGVGGLLGNDVRIRFKRLAYEFGPPDLLVLEGRD